MIILPSYNNIDFKTDGNLNYHSVFLVLRYDYEDVVACRLRLIKHNVVMCKIKKGINNKYNKILKYTYFVKLR